MTRVLKRRVEIVASLAIACVLGALWYQSAGRAHADSAPGPALIPVETALAARADVPVYIDAIGAVQASKTATVTTRVDGQLQNVSFAEGSDVRAGDLLAQIDPKPYEAQLAQAEAKKAQDQAQLDNARHDVRRYLQLSPEDYTSQQTLDAARSQVAQLTAQLKADQAAIDAAKTQLAYTSVTAPFSGRTGLRLVDEGNIVRASDTTGIVVITELQPITVVFTLPQSQLPDMLAATAAGPVTAIALSSEGQELDRGTLTLIDNKIDPATDTVRLKAIFANEQQRLWPGQFVNVRILMQTLHNVLTVPSDAVSQGPTGSFTYLLKSDGTVDMRSITVSRDVGGVAQIAAGLNDGDRVVTNGQYRLQPGARVRVDTSNAPHPLAQQPMAPERRS
jgi:membrane fusion protein, multidrug efflux system